MAIKLTNLENLSNQYKTQKFVFSDLHLDLTRSDDYSAEALKVITKNDLKPDYDLNAIKNSLNNLFNTKPGQRFLFPNYGLNLDQFIFEPITEYNGRLIGEKIVRSIQIFETRVNLKQCNVELLPDDNQYDIKLILEFPVFNTNASINTILDIRSQTFTFVESNNRR